MLHPVEFGPKLPDAWAQAAFLGCAALAHGDDNSSRAIGPLGHLFGEMLPISSAGDFWN